LGRSSTFAEMFLIKMNMDIKGKITGIKYKVLLSEDLQIIENGLFKMILYSNLSEVKALSIYKN
jgi:hypothetical protein